MKAAIRTVVKNLLIAKFLISPDSDCPITELLTSGNCQYRALMENISYHILHIRGIQPFQFCSQSLTDFRDLQAVALPIWPSIYWGKVIHCSTYPQCHPTGLCSSMCADPSGTPPVSSYLQSIEYDLVYRKLVWLLLPPFRYLSNQIYPKSRLG